MAFLCCPTICQSRVFLRFCASKPDKQPVGLTAHRDLRAYKLCWRLELLRRRCRFRRANWPLLATLRLFFPETFFGPLNQKAHHWAAQRHFRFELGRKRRDGAGFGRVRQRAQSCAPIGRSVRGIGSQLNQRPDGKKPLQWGSQGRFARPPPAAALALAAARVE